MNARFSLPIVALLLVLLPGCSGDEEKTSDYPRQGSPQQTLQTLQHAWETGDDGLVEAILAADFRFRLQHPAELPVLGVVTEWGQSIELLASGQLFTAPHLQSISIELDYGRARPVNELGREDWQVIDVGSVWIELDEAPPESEEMYTYAVNGDLQRFYFRQGLSPADHESGSATSRNWYIVDWTDEGSPAGAPAPPARLAARLARLRSNGEPVPIYDYSWTDIKLLHLDTRFPR